MMSAWAVARHGMARLRAVMARFGGEKSATSAVEFSFLALPFLMVLLGSMQIGMIYITKSTLQNATLRAADYIFSIYYTDDGAIQSFYAIREELCSRRANLFPCDRTLKMEINRLELLTIAAEPIVDGKEDFGTSGSVLVLRTEASFKYIIPGFGGTGSVSAAAIVRRP